MKKFEYKIIHSLSQYELNIMGDDGWELISIQHVNETEKYWFYFKREKK